MPDEAYLNGILLECESIEDGFEKSIVVHEFPFSNTVVTQDMGLKARTVRLKCWFYDDRYEDHRALLALLKSFSALTLTHPTYGLLRGSARAAGVRHDDFERAAVINLEFVTGTPPAAWSPAWDVASEAEAAFASGIAADLLAYEAAVTGILSEAAAPLLSQEISWASGILAQVTGISADARAYVRRVDAKVRQIEAAAADVTLPANALISTLSFAADLPNRVIGSFAVAAGRYARALNSLAGFPQRFLSTLAANLDQLTAAVWPAGDEGDGLYPAWLSACALALCLHASYGFASDQAARDANAALAGAEAFDAAGNYVRSAKPAAVMNVREIESALATCRTAAQAAIAAGRGNQAHNDMALALLSHVNQVKLEIERIVQISVDAETPLHLVLLRNGLPYSDAERVLALNPEIRNPNAVSGEVSIYVP